MKCAKTGFMGLSLIVMMTAAAPLVSAQAAHVRWDIQHVVFGTNTISFNPGGSATALANDMGQSSITMTGSGTFTSPVSGGSTGAVTGGGTWRVVPKGGGPITSGTYVVTELLSWQKSNPIAPESCFPCGLIDNIGDLHEAWGGLAVLRVAYSDGTTGIVTISCNANPDPPSVFEGIIASKGVITYLNPGPFPSYFSLFHID